MYQAYGLLIDGQWKTSANGETLSVINPADASALGCIPAAGSTDLDEALESSQRGFLNWEAQSGWERARVLRGTAQAMRALLEEAAQAMTLETGKPLAESRAEFLGAIDMFDWYADEARRIYGHTLAGRDAGVELAVTYEAVGPVAAFTAWNFPALLPARKIAAALAAGCSIILKPSEEAPSAAFIIARAALSAGLPSGVFNIVTGEPATISRHLLSSPIIKKVTFTGSTAVGKTLGQLAAGNLKRISLELGGSAPVIVFPDCDVHAAAAACAAAKFRNAGQVCISPSRFLVHADIREEFTTEVVRIAHGLKVGRGTIPQVQMGPMANERGRNRALSLVRDAIAQGARLLAGGGIPAGLEEGFFIEPTVIDDVPEHAALWRDELFAPILVISPFTDDQDAIARANRSAFGLAGYVFTQSAERARHTARSLQLGMIGINDLGLSAAEIPFGGVKDSGLGREGGKLGIQDYLQIKYVKSRYA